MADAATGLSTRTNIPARDLRVGDIVTPREGDGLPWDQILGAPLWNYLREQGVADEPGIGWTCQARIVAYDETVSVGPRLRPGDTWRSPFRPIWYPVTKAGPR